MSSLKTSSFTLALPITSYTLVLCSIIFKLATDLIDSWWNIYEKYPVDFIMQHLFPIPPSPIHHQNQGLLVTATSYLPQRIYNSFNLKMNKELVNTIECLRNKYILKNKSYWTRGWGGRLSNAHAWQKLSLSKSNLFT